MTNLTHTIIATQILTAFIAKVTPILAFARNFSDEVVQKGDKVKVLFVKAQEAAKDFEGSYVLQGAEAEGLDVSINKRKYVSWGLTSQDLATMPQIDIDRFVETKADQLARAFLQDVWSLITNANYGAAVFTGAASTLDADDIADLEATLDEAHWPTSQRSLILAPTYYGSLVKDNQVQGDLGVTSEVMAESIIRKLHNFALHKSALIPANGEYLKGFACHPDAILVAIRALMPEGKAAEAAARSGALIEKITDPGTGITLVLKDWYDVTEDVHAKVLEINYGYLKGNEAGLKRIVSQ